LRRLKKKDSLDLKFGLPIAIISTRFSVRPMALQELKELEKQFGMPLLGDQRHGAFACGKVATVPASFGIAHQEVVAGTLEFLEGVQLRVEAWVVLGVKEECR
jgi:hypothetical protein